MGTNECGGDGDGEGTVGCGAPAVGGANKTNASCGGFCSAINTHSEDALSSPVPVAALALPMNMAVERAAKKDLLKNMMVVDFSWGSDLTLMVEQGLLLSDLGRWGGYTE